MFITWGLYSQLGRWELPMDWSYEDPGEKGLGVRG